MGESPGPALRPWGAPAPHCSAPGAPGPGTQPRTPPPAGGTLKSGAASPGRVSEAGGPAGGRALRPGGQRLAGLPAAGAPDGPVPAGPPCPPGGLLLRAVPGANRNGPGPLPQLPLRPGGSPGGQGPLQQLRVRGGVHRPPWHDIGLPPGRGSLAPGAGGGRGPPPAGEAAAFLRPVPDRPGRPLPGTGPGGGAYPAPGGGKEAVGGLFHRPLAPGGGALRQPALFRRGRGRTVRPPWRRPSPTGNCAAATAPPGCWPRPGYAAPAGRAPGPRPALCCTAPIPGGGWGSRPCTRLCAA